MFLSDLAIRKALPRERPYKVSDGGGLHLLVKPNGKKLWRLKYRYAGKEKLLSLGSYPLIALAKARAERDEAKKLLLAGTDPSVRRRLDKLAAETKARNTFGAVAAEYLDNLKANGSADSTLSKNRWMLEDLAAPLSARPIAEIIPAEILDLLKRIEKTGRRETARRLRGTMGSVFRYAVVTMRATTDPTALLHRALLAPKVQHRAAIIDERKLGGLMLAIDEYDGWHTLRAAMLLLALTMTRPGDVRRMRRSEIDFEKAVWRIPAERMKMRRPHDVPLSRQALAILREVWGLSDYGELVFPSIRSLRKPLSDNAMNSALRRMGFDKNEMTAHGFRSSASTILNERGFDPDVIEAALAHQDENGVRRAYNRATYWPERVKLLQQWADLLDEFRKLAIPKRRAA
jgi:integrase